MQEAFHLTKFNFHLVVVHPKIAPIKRTRFDLKGI